MGVSSYLYTAWFRDTTMPPDDPDYEWPACFVIEARSSENARSWGDVLSRSFSARRVIPVFLHSLIEKLNIAAGDTPKLPRVRAGEWVSDEEIGW